MVSNVLTVRKFYYADEILYLTALPVIKIAILCTYLRIFQTQQFRKLVFVAIGLNVAYAITFVLITAFQCTPVQLVSGFCPTNQASASDEIVTGMDTLGPGTDRPLQQYQCSVVGIGGIQHHT